MGAMRTAVAAPLLLLAAFLAAAAGSVDGVTSFSAADAAAAVADAEADAAAAMAAAEAAELLAQRRIQEQLEAEHWERERLARERAELRAQGLTPVPAPGGAARALGEHEPAWDPFAYLGVPRDASPEAIASAHGRRVRSLLPGQPPDPAVDFAYSLLSDPQSRAQLLSGELRLPQPPPQPGPPANAPEPPPLPPDFVAHPREKPAGNAPPFRLESVFGNHHPHHDLVHSRAEEL